MARSDYPLFTARRPRHAVTDADAIHVSVERAGQPSGAIEAQLVDMSREGFRLRVSLPLEVHEDLTVRIRSERAKVDLTRSGNVRWRRADGNDAWLVGCAASEPADWETLGELFLHNILNTQALPRD